MNLKKGKQVIDAEAEQLADMWKRVLRTTRQSITAIAPSFQVGPSPSLERAGYTIIDVSSNAKWGGAAHGKRVEVYQYDPPIADPIRPNFWHGPNIRTTTYDWWIEDSTDLVKAQQHLERCIDESFLNWYKNFKRG